MRTTISIDEDLMEKLMRTEAGVSRSEAVRRAVEGHVRRRQIEAFKRLAGSRLVERDWRKTRQESIDDAKALDRKWNEVHGRTRSRTR